MKKPSKDQGKEEQYEKIKQKPLPVPPFYKIDREAGKKQSEHKKQEQPRRWSSASQIINDANKMLQRSSLIGVKDTKERLNKSITLLENRKKKRREPQKYKME